MNIIKCEKGHFYNGDRYKTCPHCEEMQQANVTRPQAAESTSYGNGQSEPKQPVRGYQLDDDMAETVAYRPVANTGDTVAYRPKPKQPENALPVGWLVAISGLEYGKQYPVFTCDNFIGSGINNSICVAGDAYVLPEHHCTLSFDFQMQKVVLNMECSMGDVYVNNAPAQESRYLNHLDRIQIGGSIYMLVELCREGFSWWKPIQNNFEEHNSEEHAQIDDIDTAFAEEYGAAIRPDISGIRAMMNQRMKQEKTPAFKEIRAGDTAFSGAQEPEVDTTEYEGDGETTVLTSATWRCTMCNGLNTEYASVCRICGARKS